MPGLGTKDRPVHVNSWEAMPGPCWCRQQEVKRPGRAHFITVAQILASLEAGWMTGRQRNMWRALDSVG